MGDTASYKNIFKITFLFSFVQIFNILVKVVTNKIVAILLGAEGMGMISLFRTATNLIQTACGLGISQSAVKDISEANASNDSARIAKIISVTQKVILLTGSLGVIVTFCLSYWLSIWTFGSAEYMLSYMFLSLAVGMEVMTQGQLAILKGLRKLRSLAYASMIGSVIGLIVVVPIYYFFNRDGIVLSLVATSLSALAFSQVFVSKIDYDKQIVVANNDVIRDSKPMIKMGISLMVVTFMGFFSTLIVSSFISNDGSLSQVGYYQAGATIIVSYFGIIVTAMSTDYYPRIAAINKNNKLLQDEVNKQSEVGLILAIPIAVTFQILAPYFIEILYTKDFLITLNYTNYAIYGTIIIISSNCMGMILLAKQASKIFLISTISQRLVFMFLYIVLYKYFGLQGLGIGYICMGLTHLILMNIIMKQRYNIQYSKKTYFYLFLAITLSYLSMHIQQIEDKIVYFLVGGIVIFCCLLFAVYKIYKLSSTRNIR